LRRSVTIRRNGTADWQRIEIVGICTSLEWPVTDMKRTDGQTKDCNQRLSRPPADGCLSLFLTTLTWICILSYVQRRPISNIIAWHYPDGDPGVSEW